VSKRTESGCISNPERLGYWYLRFNGFMTTENFVVHPDRGNQQRTDADLLAVRFANRSELCTRPMQDDPFVTDCSTLINLVIVEIKTGRCALNGPWTNPKKKNIQSVLRAIGCLPAASLNLAAKSLYEKGQYESSEVTCRLMAFGDETDDLAIPGVKQRTFDEMLGFIHKRFQAYRSQKSSVGNWLGDGKQLADMARSMSDLDSFRREARQLFGLIADSPSRTPQSRQLPIHQPNGDDDG
jgi:hypothetical protein